MSNELTPKEKLVDQIQGIACEAKLLRLAIIDRDPNTECSVRIEDMIKSIKKLEMELRL